MHIVIQLRLAVPAEQVVDVLLDLVALLAVEIDVVVPLGGVWVRAEALVWSHEIGTHWPASTRVFSGQGSLRLRTEFGVIEVGPGEVAVIPRGVKFSAVLRDGPARGYLCENYGGALTLPSDLKRVTRALLSVSDKTGLVDFARALSERDIELGAARVVRSYPTTIPPEREGRVALARACFDFLPHRAELDLAGWPEVDIFAHV